MFFFSEVDLACYRNKHINGFPLYGRAWYVHNLVTKQYNETVQQSQLDTTSTRLLEARHAPPLEPKRSSYQCPADVATIRCERHTGL